MSVIYFPDTCRFRYRQDPPALLQSCRAAESGRECALRLQLLPEEEHDLERIHLHRLAEYPNARLEMVSVNYDFCEIVEENLNTMNIFVDGSDTELGDLDQARRSGMDGSPPAEIPPLDDDTSRER